MPQSRSRRITIIVLAILTLLLLGVAVFIAIRLQTPSDVGVADGDSCTGGCPVTCCACGKCGGVTMTCNTVCGSGSSSASTTSTPGGTSSSVPPGCTGSESRCVGKSNGADLGCQGNNNPFRCKCVAVSGGTGCPDRLVVNCGTFDASCGGGGSSSSSSSSSGGGSCTPGTTISVGACGSCAVGRRTVVICNSSGQPQSTCQVDPSCSSSSSSSAGSTSSSAAGAQSCGSGTWDYSNGCIRVISGSCSLQRFSGSGCPTTTFNDGTSNSGVGTYCPSPAQGSCQQVDVVGSGQGVCACANGSTTSISVSTSQVAYSCTQMTRSPSAAELAPNQVISVTVRETSATVNSNSNVFIMSGSTVVATGTRVSGPTLSGTNSFIHTFTVTVPSNATNGSYTIRYSRTGVSTALEAAAACQSAFTVNVSAPVLATVSVVKTSGTVCDTNNGGTMNYTVTVTNNSTVAATINSVVDTLPAQVTAASQVQNTVPTASAITADTITWTGPFTLNAGANLVFTYSLVFTQAQLEAFTSSQLTNTVNVTYGTENSTAEYTLLAAMTCLPATGLLDEPAGLILIGLVLILAGILVNRSGLLLNLFGANMRSSDATNKIVETFLNTQEVQGDKFSRGVMAEQEKKYGKRKKRG